VAQLVRLKVWNKGGKPPAMRFPLPGNSERRHKSLRVRGTKWVKIYDFGN
jgi:hypothetical protein